MEIEDDLASVVRSLNQPLSQAARELMVLELYRRGALSSGRSAELLSMSRHGFIEFAGRLGLPYLDMTPDEWELERAAGRSIE
jgi:Uncharacterised protein family (UPF0175)